MQVCDNEASLVERLQPCVRRVARRLGATAFRWGYVMGTLSRTGSDVKVPPNSFVGIFWAIPNSGPTATLADHRCVMKDAELYGSKLTCPHGHLEVWDQWRNRPAGRLGVLASVVAASEYEEWPRGRVVYDCETQRFVVYADAQILRRPALMSEIRERFGLPIGRTEARRDNHYRDARRLEG